ARDPALRGLRAAEVRGMDGEPQPAVRDPALQLQVSPRVGCPSPRQGGSTMELTRRDLLKGAAALGAAGAVPIALGSRASAQTTQKRELVMAQGGDISKFDPHFSTSSNDIRVSFNIYDNLTSRHPDGKLYPGLATEWKLQGQTTWAFKLRQGVKWH